MNRLTKYMCLHLITGLALVGGCDGDTVDRNLDVVAPAAAGEHAKTVASKTSQRDAPADWRAWVDSEVSRLQSEAPELYNLVKTMPPVTTRAGSLRFAIEEHRDPQMLPILLDRLIHENNPSEVRQALAASLTQTGADYSAAAVELIAQESDPKVRVVMVENLRRIDAGPALAGLKAALEDADATVRLQAAYTIGARPDGAQLSAELLAALDDHDGEVRLQATRTLGALAVEAAKPALTQLLGSPSGDQRLHALRALGRIDADYVRTLDLAAFADDNDPRVVRAAARLSR